MTRSPNPLDEIELLPVAVYGALRLERVCRIPEQEFGWRIVEAATGAVLAAENVGFNRYSEPIADGLKALRLRGAALGGRLRMLYRGRGGMPMRPVTNVEADDDAEAMILGEEVDR